MERRLLLADAHQVRLLAARPFLSLPGPKKSIVAGDRRAADDFVREAALEHRALLGVERLSPNQAARRAAEPQLRAEQRAPVSGLGTLALVARVIHRRLIQAPLRYFEPVARLPGFAPAVDRTLGALRGHEVDAATLRALSPAGADLGDLLALYEEALAEGLLADRAEVLRRAALAPADPAPLLLLDLSPEDPLEEAFWRRQIEGRAEVWATAAPSDAQALEFFRGLGFAEHPLAEPEETALVRARRSIFAAHATKGALDSSLSLRSAPGEGPECVEVARAVLWAALAGVPFDQQAIVLRHVETYQPLVEDALRRAEIPAFYAKGVRRPDPAGRAFLLLLACKREDLSATRFAEYLSLKEVPELPERGPPPQRRVPWVEPKKDGQLSFASLVAAPPPAPEARVIHGHLRVPSQWEHLLVDAAVIGGHDRWQRRLAGLQRELEKTRDRLGPDDPGRGRLDAELGALQNLAEFALPLINQLAKLPTRAPWGGWLSALEALATQALRHPEPVLRALAELRPMAEVGPVDLTEVELTLLPRLSSLREEPEGHRFGRVWVGTPEELAGRSFRRVYLPGLAEGLFPAKTREDPLLLDVDRKKLHPNLPARAAAVRDERRRLHLCLGAASEALEVSYPRLDTARGRARVPSFYALDLLRAAEGQVPNVKAFERRAQGEGQLRLGWPAPERPEQAIDATELDLSVLAAVDPTQAPGLGRYLFGHGLPVEQAIRSFARRWRRPWSTADGLWIKEGQASTLLKGERLLERAYSPSRLESYAACPYRFFLQSIQRLEPKAEPVRIEQIDPRTKGRIVAEIQFHLVQRLIEAGVRRLAPDNLERALGLLETTLREVEQQEREDLCPAIPAVWARGFEEIRADLCGWLRDLAGNQDGYELLHAELAFGLAAGADRDPASHPRAATIFGHYRVRGSVDLVERHPERGDWRVVDHKSGKVPDVWPLAIGGGAHLQILLYAQALEALYGQKVEHGRYAYCTIRNGYTKIDLPNDATTQEALRSALDTIDRAIERGQLVPSPRSGACRYCDYATVCGPGAEDRAKSKDGAPATLNELVQLRSRR